jgi:hypothetical protein
LLQCACVLAFVCLCVVGVWVEPVQGAAAAAPRARANVILKKGSTDAGAQCHVCGAKGHCAGFIGSVYVDCPNRPVGA